MSIEDEWAKKVGLDGLKSIKWGVLSQDLVWEFIQGLVLSLNHKMIRSVVKGKVVVITQELVVEFWGLPQNFSAIQTHGFAAYEWGSQVSHNLGTNALIRERWLVTKFSKIYNMRIYAILHAIIFKKKLTYAIHTLVNCVTLAERIDREFD